MEATIEILPLPITKLAFLKHLHKSGFTNKDVGGRGSYWKVERKKNTRKCVLRGFKTKSHLKGMNFSLQYVRSHLTEDQRHAF